MRRRSIRASCSICLAHVLDVPQAAVTVELRRMGGAFGGKETQAAQWAAIAALAARKTGKPCKIRLDRDDDMCLTGKRHDFVADYEVGFDAQGRIKALDTMMAARCGYSADVSSAICDRAMFHADNAYFLPAATIATKRMKTNTVSNTAFRGFGGPQGMMVAERMIDEIAWKLGLDPLDVRKANFYGPNRDITPYGMTVEDNIAPELVESCETTSDYRKRRQLIAEFNAASATLKRGIALTPVKFGISFTTTHLNQAGALIHLYQDGSIHLNHGGTEMGQGLNTKVAQVVAEEFGVDLDHVKITATTTAKVPNTSATAASSGADMNGMAARNAASIIKERLIMFAADSRNVPIDQIEFRDNRVFIGNESVAFPDFLREAYFARISLSSTGYYRTPKIHWDKERGKGRPFYYFSYGAACSEVIVDITTGEMKVTRVDIVHDVGKSLNPAVDIGQIEGGFVQGMGWLTTEELVFTKDGRFASHAPSTYKIPCCVRRAGAFPRHALGRHQPRGDDLPLQGGRRAAADAGDLGVCRGCRRDPQPQAWCVSSARRARDAGIDLARRAGCGAGLRHVDLADHRTPDRRAGRRGAGDGRAGTRLEPARGRRPHGGGAGRRFHRHDRRRRTRMGRARGSAGFDRARRTGILAAGQGAGSRSRAMLRWPRAADDRKIRTRPIVTRSRRWHAPNATAIWSRWRRLDRTAASRAVSPETRESRPDPPTT